MGKNNHQSSKLTQVDAGCLSSESHHQSVAHIVLSHSQCHMWQNLALSLLECDLTLTQSWRLHWRVWGAPYDVRGAAAVRVSMCETTYQECDSLQDKVTNNINATRFELINDVRRNIIYTRSRYSYINIFLFDTVIYSKFTYFLIKWISVAWVLLSAVLFFKKLEAAPSVHLNQTINSHA